MQYYDSEDFSLQSQSNFRYSASQVNSYGRVGLVEKNLPVSFTKLEADNDIYNLVFYGSHYVFSPSMTSLCFC